MIDKEGFLIDLTSIVSPTKIFFTAISKKAIPYTEFFLSGVFEIPQQLNNGLLIFYICMTKRRLFKRIKEHKNDLRFDKQSAAQFRIFSKGNVMKVDFENVKVISRHCNPHKVLIRLSIEINLRIGKVCNENVLFQVPDV